MSRNFTEPPAPASELTGPVRGGCGRDSLAPVWQLNGYFLETLIEASQHPAWHGSAWETALGSNLAGVAPAVQQEISRSPVCLVDIGLSEDWSPFPLARGDGASGHSFPAFLARERATELAQMSLTLAWTLARNDLISTSIVFGVSRVRAKEIGSLGVHCIPTMAIKFSSAVRPRWLTQPRIWHHLLVSSEHSATPRLAPIFIRILQRQFADLSPATSATHLFRDSRP
jgi:hypothetical protein